VARGPGGSGMSPNKGGCRVSWMRRCDSALFIKWSVETWPPDIESMEKCCSWSPNHGSVSGGLRRPQTLRAQVPPATGARGRQSHEVVARARWQEFFFLQRLCVVRERGRQRQRQRQYLSVMHSCRWPELLLLTILPPARCAVISCGREQGSDVEAGRQASRLLEAGVGIPQAGS
jgi:hypothetical protein